MKRAPCSRCKRPRGTYRGKDDGLCRGCRVYLQRQAAVRCLFAGIYCVHGAGRLCAKCRHELARHLRPVDLVRLSSDQEKRP